MKNFLLLSFRKFLVASFAEAWIEKIYTYRKIGKKWVASFAEAWIEKLLSCILIFLELVASFAEAWIENYQNLQIQSENLSPPSRRRGLKR